jgi:hypothetical protein
VSALVVTAFVQVAVGGFQGVGFISNKTIMMMMPELPVMKQMIAVTASLLRILVMTIMAYHHDGGLASSSANHPSHVLRDLGNFSLKALQEDSEGREFVEKSFG